MHTYRSYDDTVRVSGPGAEKPVAVSELLQPFWKVIFRLLVRLLDLSTNPKPQQLILYYYYFIFY